MSLDKSDKDDVRQIVRDETADLRRDFKDMQISLDNQGVLIESLDHEFKAVAEMISSNLQVKNLVKSTLALHSRQLKTHG